MRAALWDDTYRVERSKLGSFGKMLADQTKTDRSPEQLDVAIQEAYEKRCNDRPGVKRIHDTVKQCHSSQEGVSYQGHPLYYRNFPIIIE